MVPFNHKICGLQAAHWGVHPVVIVVPEAYIMLATDYKILFLRFFTSTADIKLARYLLFCEEHPFKFTTT